MPEETSPDRTDSMQSLWGRGWARGLGMTRTGAYSHVPCRGVDRIEWTEELKEGRR